MKAKKAVIPLALLFTAAMGEGYKYAFCRNGSKIFNPIMDKKSHRSDYYIHRDGAARALREAPQQRFTIRSERGELLRGFYIPCGEKPCGRIAFLVHGYRSEHAEAAGMYREYYKSRGFDLFCVDHTAAGESEGHFIGYDVLESRDCLRWLDFLQERFGSDIEVILHGFSMGGATVLSMSDRCPPCVRFIVDDCGFSSPLESLRPRLGLLLWPMAAINRVVAGYSLRDGDVRPHLRRAKLPILFVHGTEDSTVPFAMGKELYEMYQGPKDCLFVEGAHHVESMHRAPEAYCAKLDKFINQYIK